MKKIQTRTYSINIPEEWEVQHNEDDLTALFNSKGVGAITVSSFSSPTRTPDVVNALGKFVQGRGDIKKIKINQLDAAESEYEDQKADDSVFVYAVAIGNFNQLLLISYNCKKRDFSQSELKEVKDIIATAAFNED